MAEVGCGAGEILRLLSGELDPATQFVGYDVSPQAHELAAARESERVRFVLATRPRPTRSTT